VELKYVVVLLPGCINAAIVHHGGVHTPRYDVPTADGVLDITNYLAILSNAVAPSRLSTICVPPPYPRTSTCGKKLVSLLKPSILTTMDSNLTSYLVAAAFEKEAGAKADAPPTVSARAARDLIGAMLSNLLCSSVKVENDQGKAFTGSFCRPSRRVEG
jgi:hypothetical protein